MHVQDLHGIINDNIDCGHLFRESEESNEHHKIGDIMLSNLLQMKVKYF